jgi:hypothetical protein
MTGTVNEPLVTEPDAIETVTDLFATDPVVPKAVPATVARESSPVTVKLTEPPVNPALWTVTFWAVPATNALGAVTSKT